MTDNIDVVVKETGSAQVIQSFDGIAAAAQRANTSITALQKIMGSVGRSTAAANRVTALGTAAQGAAAHVANLNTAMNTLNTTKVTANIRSANQALGQTGTAAAGATLGLNTLLRTFLSFQAIKGVISSLIDAQITMQQIHFGLLSASGSAEIAGQQFEFLRKNAQTLGIDLKSSAQEFTRLSAAASAMNVPVEKQQELYTALSKAATVLHLDQQKVQFATLGLTQMFSRGKIQSEELRRQLGEAVPGAAVRFQKAVMESIKGTDLQGQSFDSLLKKGKLVTSQFLPELIQALSETGQGWEEASQGMNAEINRLKNAWFELKNDLSTGLFSDAVVATVRFLAQHMREVAAATIALGTALAIALAPAAIIKFIEYVKVLGSALWLAAGPWGIIAGLIAGVITYLVMMRDHIKLSSDSLATFGDFVSVIWDDIKGFVSTVSDIFIGLADNIKNILVVVSPVFAVLNYLFENYELTANGAFDDITSSNDSTWLKILKVVARTIDAIVGLIIGLGVAWYNVIKEMASYVAEMFGNSFAAIKAGLSGDFDTALDLLKKNISNFKGYFGRLGKAAGEGFDTGFSIVANHGLEQYINGVQKEANDRAKFRNVVGNVSKDKPVSPDSPVTEPKGPDKDAADKARREMDKLKDSLENLLGQIDPTQGALKKLAEAQEILNQVNEKGTPEMKKMVEALGGADHIMGLLKEKYKDALDPVGALNDKYDRELQSLKAITPEQKATAVAQEAMNDARKKGYDAATQAALGEVTYRRELEKTQAQLIATAEAQIYQNSATQKAKDATTQVTALTNQYAQGTIGSGQYGVGVSQAYGLTPGIADQYKADQEQYAAHLTAMQALRDQYHDLAAVSDGAARDAYLDAETNMNHSIMQMEVEKNLAKLNGAASTFGQLAGLMSSHNKKAFKIGQAAAIAEVAVKTPQAAMDAYSSLAGIPYVGPILGAAAAAAAVVMGMQQISQIRSQQPPSFRTGGSMIVGGSGGIDSQLVQFNATPGENISINTPAEARALQDLKDEVRNGIGGRGGIGSLNVTVVQQGRADRTTPEQNARLMRKEAVKLLEG